MVEVGWQANDSQSQVVHLAAEFADSIEWAEAGFSSASRWIAEQLDIAHRTANEWIRVGRCLRELPLTAAALDGKTISFSKAKELTRSATPENELDLLEIAEDVPASELGKAIAGWLQRNEPDSVIDARHQDLRSLRWQTERDGMVGVSGRLPPGAAGVLASVVDAQVNVLGSGGADVVTEVVIHVRGDGATLDDGTPITMSSVAGLVHDSFIRLLIHDAERRPINLSSKQRHPTVRQKRVVKERDQACVDCGSRELLQYDHVPDYAESRRTVVAELELRCATCHRFRHSQAS